MRGPISQAVSSHADSQSHVIGKIGKNKVRVIATWAIYVIFTVACFGKLRHKRLLSSVKG